MENEIEMPTIPEEDKKDAAYTALKAALSAIPYIGGPVAELLKYVIAPPIDKRRDDWLENIAYRLYECEKKIESFKVNDLRGNDLFITIFLNATAIAIRNHQSEKLLYLQNAVLNTAIKIPIEENMQIMFINMIDTLTPLHLRVLKYFHDPKIWLENNKVSELSLKNVFPELAYDKTFYNRVIRDLINFELVSEVGAINYHFTDNSKMKYEPVITNFGKVFLKYCGLTTG
jgi:hypothetical protein